MRNIHSIIADALDDLLDVEEAVTRVIRDKVEDFIENYDFEEAVEALIDEDIEHIIEQQIDNAIEEVLD